VGCVSYDFVQVLFSCIFILCVDEGPVCMPILDTGCIKLLLCLPGCIVGCGTVSHHGVTVSRHLVPSACFGKCGSVEPLVAIAA